MASGLRSALGPSSTIDPSRIPLGRCSTKQIGPQEMDSSSILSATATLTNNISTSYAVGKLLDAYSLEYSR